MTCILPTQKDAAPNLGRFTYNGEGGEWWLVATAHEEARTDGYVSSGTFNLTGADGYGQLDHRADQGRDAMIDITDLFLLGDDEPDAQPIRGVPDPATRAASKFHHAGLIGAVPLGFIILITAITPFASGDPLTVKSGGILAASTGLLIYPFAIAAGLRSRSRLAHVLGVATSALLVFWPLLLAPWLIGFGLVTGIGLLLIPLIIFTPWSGAAWWYTRALRPLLSTQVREWFWLK